MAEGLPSDFLVIELKELGEGRSLRRQVVVIRENDGTIDPSEKAVREKPLVELSDDAVGLRCRVLENVLRIVDELQPPAGAGIHEAEDAGQAIPSGRTADINRDDDVSWLFHTHGVIIP